MSRFQRPLPLPHLLDEGKVNELFNYARNFDLDEIKLFGLQNHLPLSVINGKNENLIHIIISVEDNTASEEKRLKIIKYLVNNGVHPDLPNQQGITPLHYACEKQYSKIISYLLDLEVNPNTPDYLGKTPLHYLLSGIIKNWVNKSPRPLVIGKRDSNEEENKLKKELKLEIYKFLKSTKLKDFDNFIKVVIENVDMENLDYIFNDLHNNLKEQKKFKLDISNIEKIISGTIKEIKDEYGTLFNNDLFLSGEDFLDDVTELIKSKISKNNVDLEDEIKTNFKELSKLTEFCNSKLVDDTTTKITEIDRDAKITDKERAKSRLFGNRVDIFNGVFKKDYIDFENKILVINEDLSQNIETIDKDDKTHIEGQLKTISSKLEKNYYLVHQSYDLTKRIDSVSLSNLNELNVLRTGSSSDEIIRVVSKVCDDNLAGIPNFDTYKNIMVRVFLCILDQETAETNVPYLDHFHLLNKFNQLYSLGKYLNGSMNEVFLQVLRLEMGKNIKWFNETKPEDDKEFDKLTDSDQLKFIINEQYRSIYFNNFLTKTENSNMRAKHLSELLDLNFVGFIEGDASMKNIIGLYQNIFCLCVAEMEKLLLKGKYPILKVLKITDLNNLDRYWAKVMKYHMRLLIYLFSHMQVMFYGGLGEYMSSVRANIKYEVKNINLLIDNINENNIYLFLYHYSKSSKSTFNLSDYYENEIEDLREDLILPEKILSYTYPIITDERPKELIKDELTGGGDLSNNSLFKYHTNTKDNISEINPEVKMEVNSLNKDDFPDALKTLKGLNIFYNIFVFNIVKRLLGEKKIDDLVEDLVKTSGFNLKKYDEVKAQVILNLVKDMLEQYSESSKEKAAREILSHVITVPEIREQLITQIESFDESVSLQLIDYELKSVDLPTIIQKIYFPIMEDNKTNPDDFYFSNDYTKSDFELQVREIKFNKEALTKLLERGANPFIEDKMNQSPLYLLSKNYCTVPLDVLGKLGIDLRIKNKNEISPLDILTEEKNLHLEYLNPFSPNLKDYLSGLTNKFYQEIEGMIESKESSGFNYPRYSKLGFNLMLYFVINELSNSPTDILSLKLNNIDSYVNDYTLGQKILSDKGGLSKIYPRRTKLNFNGSGKTVQERWIDFTDKTFINSPALFLDSLDNLLGEITRKPIIHKNNKKALSYFTNHRFYRENDLFEKTSRWVHLVSNMVLATQVQLIIGNLIFAHYQLKNPTLDIDSIRINYETDIKQDIINDKYKQSLPEIIRTLLIPKLVKSIALTFEDEVDKESHDEYTISEMIQEIVDCLKILGIVSEKDMLINVLQNQVNEYLDLYVPRYIQSLRCIAENYYRWVINYNKINKLISVRAS